MSDFKLTDKLLLKLHLELDRLGIRDRNIQKGYLSPLEDKDEMVHPEGIRPPGRLAKQFIAQARKGVYAPPPGRPEPPSIPFEKESRESASAHDEGVLVGTRAVSKSELDEIEQESRDLIKWQSVHVLTAVRKTDMALSTLESKVRSNAASRLEEEDYWYNKALRDQLEYWYHDVFLDPLPEHEDPSGASRSDYELVNQELATSHTIIKGLRKANTALKTMRGLPSQSELKNLMDTTRKKNGIANWTKLGEALGRSPETAKRYTQKLGLMSYAEVD